MVVFGDSLSDNGNSYKLTGGAPPFPYYNGEFSNGPVWNQIVSTDLGTGLQNTAYGGATTGCLAGATTGTQGKPVPVPNTIEQVNTYVSGNGGTVDPANLYNVFIGGNDVLNTLGGAGPATPSCMAGNLSIALTGLVNAGAKNIALYELPNLGKTPLALGGGAKAIEVAQGLSLGYNVALPATAKSVVDAASAAGKTGVRIEIVPVQAMFDEMLANPPTLNGQQVTILDKSCIVNNTLCEQGMTSTPLNQVPSYFFYDAVHPT
jgi:outer membrane lipase/esterase